MSVVPPHVLNAIEADAYARLIAAGHQPEDSARAYAAAFAEAYAAGFAESHSLGFAAGHESGLDAGRLAERERIKAFVSAHALQSPEARHWLLARDLGFSPDIKRCRTDPRH